MKLEDLTKEELISFIKTDYIRYLKLKVLIPYHY